MKTFLSIFVSILFIQALVGQHSPEVKTIPFFNTIETDVFKKSSREFLSYFKISTSHEIDLIATTHDTIGRQDKYQQYYKGVPIENDGLTIHHFKNRPPLYSGMLYDIKNLSVKPKLSWKLAQYAIIDELDGELAYDDCMISNPELVVYVENNNLNTKAYLSYKTNIYSLDPLYKGDVFIDAHTGDLIAEEMDICTNSTPVMGKSLHNGNVIVSADSDDGLYSLSSDNLMISTYNLNGGLDPSIRSDIVSVDNVFNYDSIGIQAQYGAEQTYYYYKYRHNRDSYDNLGSPLKSFVGYGQRYNNAFWDGKQMIYGDGDGRNFGPMVSIDISGHEISHGVIDHSADLKYNRESGALNESFADIFGEMVEYFATGDNDWILGADIALTKYQPFRSMQDPNRNNNPDTYGGMHWYNPNCERPLRSNDYCGVHINSGIQNKWFYILSIGETGINDHNEAYDVVGITRNSAAAIAYRNLSVYLNSDADFVDARRGSIQSAIDLFGKGSYQEIATTNAWFAVGVGAAYTESSTVLIPELVSIDTTEVTDHSITILFKNLSNSNSSLFDIYLDGTLYGSTIDTSYILSGLMPNTQYEIKLRYQSTFDSSILESNILKVLTKEKVPTEKIKLTLDQLTSNGALLSWNSIGIIEHYDIYLNDEWLSMTMDTIFLLEGLVPDTDNQVWIVASNNNSIEIYSDTLKIHTLAEQHDYSLIFASFFETGWDGWTNGNSDDATWYTGRYSPEGNGSIRLRDDSDGSIMTSPSIYSENWNVSIEFSFYSWSMEMSDGFALEILENGTWNTIRKYTSYTDFNNYSFNALAIHHRLTNNDFKLRFRNLANANSDHIYIDKVLVSTEHSPNNFLQENCCLHNPEIVISPNPVVDILTLDYSLFPDKVSLYGPSGKLIYEGEPVSQIDMSNKAPGIYFLVSNTEDKKIISKIIKI